MTGLSRRSRLEALIQGARTRHIARLSCGEARSGTLARPRAASAWSGRPLRPLSKEARERIRDNVVITLVAAPLPKLSSSFGGGRRLFRLLGRRWE